MSHRIRAMVLVKADREKVMEYNDAALMRVLESEKGTWHDQDWWAKDTQAEWPLLFDEKARELKQHLEAKTVPWENLTGTGRGVELGKEGTVMRCPACRKWDTLPERRDEAYRSKKCIHCQHVYQHREALEHRTIIQEAPHGPSWKPYVAGEDVNRYHVSSRRWIDTSLDGIRYKDPATYDGKKLLVRKTGVGIMATITTEPLLFPQTVYYWKEKPDRIGDAAAYDLAYLLAIISSRLMLWWFYHKTGITEWRSFPYVTQEIVQSFPIHPVNWKDKKETSAYSELLSLVQKALDKKGPISNELDWQIEDRLMELYDVSNAQRAMINNFFRTVAPLRIVREMYPEFGASSAAVPSVGQAKD